MSSVLVETFETPAAQAGGTPWSIAINEFADNAARFMFGDGIYYQGPDLKGTALRYRRQFVRWHGAAGSRYGGDWVAPGRTVVEVPGRKWAVKRPEDCTAADRRSAWFYADGRQMTEDEAADLSSPEPVVLLCLNCGLDGT
ncbi:hypothetical protein C8D87_114128 [Lentzea atacamensis]|uniref:Uncharacterized protein n=1 Tax=Lentzea atacamensis TaxID=531938 RepID=A0ABX9DW51_9PSEU|nr:hypothetical protein [Lentzea atacamensis]RAS59516.1 hypothetical protein C8D87_114128 [Lentzea atacamensis]